LFVYIVKLIGTELWMAKEGAELNGSLEIWIVEGKDKKGNSKAMETSLSLSWSVLGDGRFYLSWLVVVVFDFCRASNYSMASNVFVGMVSIRGWCWGLMTKREEVQAREKGACRGSTCVWIEYNRYLLNFSLIHVVG
jgi:hypothetical protein